MTTRENAKLTDDRLIELGFIIRRHGDLYTDGDGNCIVTDRHGWYIGYRAGPATSLCRLSYAPKTVGEVRRLMKALHIPIGPAKESE